MTTTQIIIAVAIFAISISVSLIVYIWVDAKKTVANAVTEPLCESRRDKLGSDMEVIESHLKNHTHDSHGGKATVEL